MQDGFWICAWNHSGQCKSPRTYSSIMGRRVLRVRSRVRILSGVQCEIRNRPTKSGVLCLQFLETFHLIDPHTAVFLPPAVVGHLVNAKFSDNLRHLHPLCQQDFGFSQLGDDFFGS